MPNRRLPSLQEAQRILAERRTRPAWRAAPTAGRSLNALIKGLEARFGQGPDVLRARWREIAGEVLAARTEPVKLVRSRTGGGGTLEIRVDGPAAALIQHQAPQILGPGEPVSRLGRGGQTTHRARQGLSAEGRLAAGARPPPKEPAARRRRGGGASAGTGRRAGQSIDARPAEIGTRGHAPTRRRLTARRIASMAEVQCSRDWLR